MNINVLVALFSSSLQISFFFFVVGWKVVKQKVSDWNGVKDLEY